MNYIHFLVARSPSMDPQNLIKVLNHCAAEDWEVIRISREMMPTGKKIIVGGTGQPQMAPIDVIYCQMLKIDFEEYFDREYTVKNAVEVMADIEKEIFSDKKEGVTIG